MEYSDGENLSDSEVLEVSVEFLKFKSVNVLKELSELIPHNMTDSQSRTLLHWAAHQGHLKKAQFLVEEGLVDPCLRDYQHNNCLELAAKTGHSAMIDYLSELGLECCIPDINERLNPEPDLSVEGQIAAAIYADNPLELSQKCTNYLHNIDGFFSLAEFYEWTLLGAACYHCSPKCLRWVLEQEPEVTKESGEAEPLETLLSMLLSYMPPEEEEEFIQVSNGVECLYELLPRVPNLDSVKGSLQRLFKRSGFTGTGSSYPISKYEREVALKVDKMRLDLSGLLK